MLLSLVIATISILLTIQASHALWMALHTWNSPEAELKSRVPTFREAPSYSFTAILPARHEEAVINRTLYRVAHQKYPPDLCQILVVCSDDDLGTISVVNETINSLRKEGIDYVKLVTFGDQPINKPHGLNVALEQATGDVITVFDAEDIVHEEIFDIVNTIMVSEEVRVVQAGTQLMNYHSSWFSVFNVLEYYVWFKSRLHYHSAQKVILLGGNTIFFARELLDKLGGWDETCLTEDADIGLRLSVMEEPVRVAYDSRYVTKEETPPTVKSFVKQRTRWNQGFMQTYGKGTWKELSTKKQRFMAQYTLLFPIVQAFVGLYLPFGIFTTFVWDVPAVVALVSFLPVVLLGAHFVLQVLGLREFTQAHGFTLRKSMIAKMALTWFPYQVLLSFAAIRAAVRHTQGKGNWERTTHVGAHLDG